jgi:5'-nucleotidase
MNGITNQYNYMKGLTIYLDMDGVLANFQEAAEKHPDYGKKGFKADLELDFSTFTPMPGAIDAVAALLDMGHRVYIATTPPWNHPSAWGQKRDWVEKHLPALKRKMFLTHHKNMLKGDILIDDTTYRGQKEFEGEFIWFGQDGFDWKKTVDVIRQITELGDYINGTSSSAG